MSKGTISTRVPDAEPEPTEEDREAQDFEDVKKAVEEYLARQA